MKNMSRKDLMESVKTGKIDIGKMRTLLLKKPQQAKIDDREPTERMADGFENLAESIKIMNKTQLSQFTYLAQSLVDALGKPKDEKTNNSKWEIEVDAKRDSRGLLEYPYKIKITRT